MLHSLQVSPNNKEQPMHCSFNSKQSKHAIKVGTKQMLHYVIKYVV